MKKLRIVLLVVFAALFLFSAYKVISIMRYYHKDTSYYNDVADQYKETFSKEEPTETETPPETETSTEEIPETTEPTEPEPAEIVWPDFSQYEQEAKTLPYLHTNLEYVVLPRFVFDFDSLLSVNPDVRGWIMLSDTEIDYPLVQGTSNQTYIRSGPDGQPHNAGSIFLDYRNAGDFSDRNTVIYGHNQNNHKMFHDLYSYLDQAFADAHPFFNIYKPDGTCLTYEVAACYVTPAIGETYHIYFDTDAEFEEYVQYVMNESEIDCGVTLTAADKIVTLSTCTNIADENRVVVQARLVTNH